MNGAPHKPIVFWVVGAATNVGKSTLALGLLRHFNARGIAALGFKPFAGSRLRKHIDFAVQHYPLVPARIFGRDSLMLARGSPLTTDADVDLITPWQLLFHHTSDDTLLLRTGSAQLGNVSFFTTASARRLLTRADLTRLARILNLPFEAARDFDPQTTSRRQLAPEVHAEAYAALLQRKPEVVVVEAAGPFLPTWKGAPPVNHVVAVSNDAIVLYPGVNAQIAHVDGLNEHAYTRQLLNAFARRALPSHSTAPYLVETADVGAVTDRLVADLLARAGL